MEKVLEEVAVDRTREENSEDNFLQISKVDFTDFMLYIYAENFVEIPFERMCECFYTHSISINAIGYNTWYRNSLTFLSLSDR